MIPSSSLYNVSQQNKNTKQHYDMMIKNAKANAEKGKYAIKIQRCFRSMISRSRLRRKEWGEWAARVKDIGKAVSIPKIKAVFFLGMDKFVPLIVGICNGLKKEDLKKGKPTIEDINKVIGILIDVLICGYNFYEPKVVVNNIVYNYITGHRRAVWTLDLLIFKLRVLLKHIKEREDCSNLLRNLWMLFVQLADINHLKSKISESTLLEPTLVNKYMNNLMGLMPLLLPYCCSALPEISFDSPFLDTANIAMVLKGYKDARDLKIKNKPTIEMLRSSLVIGDKKELDRLAAVALSPNNQHQVYLHHYFFDEVLQFKKKDLGFGKGVELAQFFLRCIIERERETENSIYSMEDDDVEKMTNYSISCDILVTFLLQLTLEKPQDDLIVTIYTSFKNDDEFFRKLINLTYKMVQKVVSLTSSSTVINLPSTHHFCWLHLILGSLKYRMLTSTCEEFLSIGPNLDKILQIVFYLQNYTTYNHMLGSSLDTTSQLLAKMTSDVIKQLYEYNQIRKFFDPSRLTMCKLNTFLYQTVSKGVEELDEVSFSHVYSLLCLFPISFDFTTRINLFYKALPTTCSSAVYVKIRRDSLIEDARRLLDKMLQSQNPSAKIRVSFVDEYGIEEAGYDDGGLFKEFLVLTLKKVE